MVRLVDTSVRPYQLQNGPAHSGDITAPDVLSGSIQPQTQLFDYVDAAPPPNDSSYTPIGTLHSEVDFRSKFELPGLELLFAVYYGEIVLLANKIQIQFLKEFSCGVG